MPTPQTCPPTGVAHATIPDELVVTSMKLGLLYEPILCRNFADENKTFQGVGDGTQIMLYVDMEVNGVPLKVTHTITMSISS